jgi:hypothetical protein
MRNIGNITRLLRVPVIRCSVMLLPKRMFADVPTKNLVSFAQTVAMNVKRKEKIIKEHTDSITKLFNSHQKYDPKITIGEQLFPISGYRENDGRLYFNPLRINDCVYSIGAVGADKDGLLVNLTQINYGEGSYFTEKTQFKVSITQYIGTGKYPCYRTTVTDPLYDIKSLQTLMASEYANATKIEKITS